MSNPTPMLEQYREIKARYPEFTTTQMDGPDAESAFWEELARRFGRYKPLF